MGKSEKTTAFSFLPRTLVALSECRNNGHASKAAMDSDAKL